jgi:hypothetical protein
MWIDDDDVDEVVDDDNAQDFSHQTEKRKLKSGYEFSAI